MSNKYCTVCDNENSKYKCPKCVQLYCSIACCNEHKKICKENNELKSSTKQISEDKTSSLKYNFPTEDTVPIQKLEELRNSEKVINQLKNPQVRDIIKSVLKDKNPTKAISEAMMEPIFVEFADACLEVTEPPDEDKPC